MRTELVPYGTAFVLSLAVHYPVYAAPASVISVKLEDSSADSSIRNMRMSIDHDIVNSGLVTFSAVNQSKKLIHEVIVVKEDPRNSLLPYNEKKSQVIESQIRHLGEISDLKPGASGKLTLKLKPGTYLLICNQPGHYKAGMSTPFSVKE